jgi:hypothetical protein
MLGTMSCFGSAADDGLSSSLTFSSFVRTNRCSRSMVKSLMSYAGISCLRSPGNSEMAGEMGSRMMPSLYRASARGLSVSRFDLEKSEAGGARDSLSER